MSFPLHSPNPSLHHTPIHATARRNPSQTFTTFLSFDFWGLPFFAIYSHLVTLYNYRPIRSPSTSDLVGFLFSTLPLHIYLVLLLRIPPFYKARITGYSTNISSGALPQFIVTEWRLLMAISTLLLSVVLAIFQLQGAFTDPLLRLAGFLSFSFGFFSFLYGCLLINQLGSSETSRAAVSEDQIESGGTEFQPGTHANRWTRVFATNVEAGNGYWNTSVLLALPAIWTAWSAIAFICTFVLLIYRTTTLTRTTTVTAATGSGLLPNAAVMVVLALGTMYLVLAIRTLRSW